MLCSISDTATGPGNTSTPWLAGLDLSAFPGPGLDQKVAQAAKYIRADVLSPAAVSDYSPVNDPKALGFIPFTTKVSERVSQFCAVIYLVCLSGHGR